MGGKDVRSPTAAPPIAHAPGTKLPHSLACDRIQTAAKLLRRRKRRHLARPLPRRGQSHRRGRVGPSVGRHRHLRAGAGRPAQGDQGTAPARGRRRARAEQPPQARGISGLHLRDHHRRALPRGDARPVRSRDLRSLLLSRQHVSHHRARGTVGGDRRRRGTRIEKNPDLLARGVDRLAHAIMDGSVDAYFPLLDKIDEFVDSSSSA